MVMPNPIVLFTILLLFATHCNTFAQTEDFPFAMGVPAEIDEAFEDLPVKARLVSENYRGVGSKASLAKYAPTPKSQGKYGTCTAWAAGYCGRTILEAQRQGWTDQSVIDANTFSIGFLYRISSAHADCNGAFVTLRQILGLLIKMILQKATKGMPMENMPCVLLLMMTTKMVVHFYCRIAGEAAGETTVEFGSVTEMPLNIFIRP
jgi:hypothetical protein